MMTLGPCFWEVGGWVLDVKILGFWSESRADLTAQAYQKIENVPATIKRIGFWDKANKQATRHKQCTFVRKNIPSMTKKLWVACHGSQHMFEIRFPAVSWRKKINPAALKNQQGQHVCWNKTEKGCNYIKIALGYFQKTYKFKLIGK